MNKAILVAQTEQDDVNHYNHGIWVHDYSNKHRFMQKDGDKIRYPLGDCFGKPYIKNKNGLFFGYDGTPSPTILGDLDSNPIYRNYLDFYNFYNTLFYGVSYSSLIIDNILNIGNDLFAHLNVRKDTSDFLIDQTKKYEVELNRYKTFTIKNNIEMYRVEFKKTIRQIPRSKYYRFNYKPTVKYLYISKFSNDFVLSSFNPDLIGKYILRNIIKAYEINGSLVVGGDLKVGGKTTEDENIVAFLDSSSLGNNRININNGLKLFNTYDDALHYFNNNLVLAFNTSSNKKPYYVVTDYDKDTPSEVSGITQVVERHLPIVKNVDLYDKIVFAISINSNGTLKSIEIKPKLKDDVKTYTSDILETLKSIINKHLNEHPNDLSIFNMNDDNDNYLLFGNIDNKDIAYANVESFKKDLGMTLSYGIESGSVTKVPIKIIKN